MAKKLFCFELFRTAPKRENSEATATKLWARFADELREPDANNSNEHKTEDLRACLGLRNSRGRPTARCFYKEKTGTG